MAQPLPTRKEREGSNSSAVYRPGARFVGLGGRPRSGRGRIPFGRAAFARESDVWALAVWASAFPSSDPPAQPLTVSTTVAKNATIHNPNHAALLRAVTTCEPLSMTSPCPLRNLPTLSRSAQAGDLL